MPKAPPISSDPSSLSEVDLKKRKNADAQAAFRARRANYISTLEHTVTTLESVVVQLQASCRDSHSVAEQVKAEYNRLKHEYRDRENFWRALWLSKKSPNSDPDDLPPFPESLLSPGPQFPTYTPPSPPSYTTPSYYSPPSQVSFTDSDSSLSNPTQRDDRNRYHPYHYGVSSVHSSENWSTAPPSPASAPGSAYGHSSAVSPVDMNGAHRSSIPGIEAPYSFSDTRSISPMSAPGTPAPQTGSPSSTYALPFQSGMPLSHDRGDYEFPSPKPEVTFHGGMADISTRTGPGADALRQRLAMKRESRHLERPLLPPLQTAQEVASSSGRPPNMDNTADFLSQLPPRSPSPEGPQISDTLAVIKASAFGALRRARTRKKNGDVAAKAAHDVLEARGLHLASFRGPSGSNDQAYESKPP